MIGSKTIFGDAWRFWTATQFRKLVLPIVGALTLLFPATVTARTILAPTAALEALIDSYAKHRGFNGTVLVARGDTVLVRASYGSADVQQRRGSDPSLSYRIGSLTKPFTATLVMRLVSEGRLKLDGTLGEFLPDLYAGTAAAPITVAQLLSHTSGIADVPGRYDDPWWRTSARETWTPTEFARRWIKPVLLEKPGTQWRYNNNGFFLLGLIVERVTGKSYAENLQKRIFGPAGMAASGLFSRNTPTNNFATAYAASPTGKPTLADAIDPSVSFSAAGIYATIDDLFRFDRALYGKLLDDASRHEMLSAHTKFYGFGWNVDDYKLPTGLMLPVVSHTGSIPGYQSYYLRSEPNQDCVIILDNFWQGTLVSEMGRDLIEVLNGKPMQLARYSLGDLLMPIAYERDIDAMIGAYRQLGSRSADYDLREGAFNDLGYKFLRNNRPLEAIQVFTWATELYPRSSNTFDSLGEGYRAAGMSTESISSYEKALALDPESKSARAALTELQGGRTIGLLNEHTHHLRPAGQICQCALTGRTVSYRSKVDGSGRRFVNVWFDRKLTQKQPGSSRPNSGHGVTSPNRHRRGATDGSPRTANSSA